VWQDLASHEHVLSYRPPSLVVDTFLLSPHFLFFFPLVSSSQDLARRGFHVLLVGRNSSALHSVAKELRDERRDAIQEAEDEEEAAEAQGSKGPSGSSSSTVSSNTISSGRSGSDELRFSPLKVR
jgi:hypothetical protein